MDREIDDFAVETENSRGSASDFSSNGLSRLHQLRTAHRAMFDRVAPALHAHGMELEYRDPYSPSPERLSDPDFVYDESTRPRLSREAHRAMFDRLAPALRDRGMELEYRDPYIPSFDIGRRCFRPDGSRLVDPLPMSLHDALHPIKGDEIVATPLHFQLAALLFGAACLRFKDDPTFFWLTDTEFDLRSISHGVIRPDVAILLNVVNQRSPRLGRFYLDREPEGQLRLPLAIEVASRSTHQNDFFDKLLMYGDAGFEQYIVVDIHQGPIQLLDYRPTQSYKPREPRPDGRVLIESLRIWVETDGEKLIFIDATTNEPIADHPQAIEQLRLITQERDQAKQEATSAKRKATKAEKKAADAEQEARDAKALLENLLKQVDPQNLDPDWARRAQEMLNNRKN